MKIIALLIIIVIIVWLQSGIFVRLAFYKLDYRCIFSRKEAHEGDTFNIIETVHNNKIIPVPWLKVDIHTFKWLQFASTSSVIAQENRRVSSSFFLKAYQRTTRRWNVKCLKRGVFNIQNITLVSGDLFGGRSTSIPVSSDSQIMVYPQILNLEKLFAPPRDLTGNTIIRRWILDDPFIVQGTREYQPSDSMRRIHWISSAKQGSLMVRNNDYTTEVSLAVLLNIKSMEQEYEKVIDREITEFGIKVAASILDHYAEKGVPMRFGTNGYTFDNPGEMILTKQGSGIEHLRELLTILAKLELANERDYSIYLEQTIYKLENSDICIISAYVTEQMAKQISLLSANNNKIKLFILDPVADISCLPGNVEVFIMQRSEKDERIS